MPLAPVRNRNHTRDSKKKRYARLLRNVVIGIAILAVLIGGTYAALLWFNNPQAALTVKEPDATNQQNPSFMTPHKPPKDVAIGSSIQSISSPIAPGNNASLTLRTTESAVCTIKVVRIDAAMREVQRVSDSGLSDKEADDFGVVTWTWTMPADAVIAKWQADITCTRDSKSTRSIGEIEVQKAKG